MVDFLNLPYLVHAAIIDELDVPELASLSLTCRAMRESLYPLPLELARIKAGVGSRALWKLFDGLPSLAAHVRSLEIDELHATDRSRPRIPEMQLLRGEEEEEGEEIGNGMDKALVLFIDVLSNMTNLRRLKWHQAYPDDLPLVIWDVLQKARCPPLLEEADVLETRHTSKSKRSLQEEDVTNPFVHLITI